jgi:hypothetical protein
MALDMRVVRNEASSLVIEAFYDRKALPPWTERVF